MYNASGTIEKTLMSINDQSYKNYEIIIVDDGSNDDSVKKVERFFNEFKGLRYIIIKQKNMGVSVARNKGLKVSKGDLIALLDSDDYWKSNKLEEQIKVLQEHPQIDLLATNRNGESYKRFFLKRLNQLNPISCRMMMYKNFLITPTVIFKKEILGTTGFFDERLTHAEDWDYFIRITKNYQAYLLNKSLVITGEGKPNFGHSGLSANLWKMYIAERKTIRKAKESKAIGALEVLIIEPFLFLKFLRRVIISFIKKRFKSIYAV